MKALSKLPLFEREKRRQVETLVVRRFEDGRWLRAPHAFRAEELPDREAVREKFGGGRYDLIGRDGRRIIARTTFIIDGPPLPLGDEALPPKEAKPGEPAFRVFATPAGEREALVFALFDRGLATQEITRMTGIEARVVRGIYLDWITPEGCPVPVTPEQIADYARMRRARLSAEVERDWRQSWS